MKGSMRAAAALAVGYFLGRQHRLRTAVLLAAATAVGGSTVGGMVLRRGMKMASSTEAIGKIAPQLTEIVDTVRDDLLDAAKAAAAAAVTNQLDTLTDSLHERADRLRDVGAGTVEDVGEAASGATGQAAATGRAAAGGGRRAASGVAGRAASTVGGAARRATGRRRPAARDEDEYEADEYEADEYEAEEPADEAGEADEYEAESEEGYEPAEGEEEEVGRDEEPVKVPAQRTAARRRSPVTRARR
jgi:hypothetical protein